ATSLAISNRGTRPVSVEVVGVDPDGNVVFDPDPAALTVEANSASFVKVKLRAAHPFRKGVPQTRPLLVPLTEAGAPTAALVVAVPGREGRLVRAPACRPHRAPAAQRRPSTAGCSSPVRARPPTRCRRGRRCR